MSVSGSSDLIGKAPGGRKLIAVVYADMVGYSRLVELDDLGTTERLRTLRSTLIDPAIAEHGGRLVQTGGDSLLVMFDSIDGAVRCTVKIQQQVPSYDADARPDQAIRFRIGINIGDVIADDTNLHGEAVNVAARLEAECPPGDICVSRAVRDHVRGRLDLSFDELGALSLKNIGRPVEAFVLRVGPNAGERRLRSSAAPPHLGVKKQKPPPLSVLVAPLRNLGVPAEYEYLVEGIPEDISTDLSARPDVFVADFSAALPRSGDAANPRDIARELGVRYLIQGSIRGIVGRLSVNLQLIHVETGAHLWSERLHIDPGITADAGNEISNRTTLTFFHKFLEDANRRIEATAPADWTPDDLATRGRVLLPRSVTAPGDRQEALSCFEQALKQAPDAIFAKLGIASIFIIDVGLERSPSGGPDEMRAEQLLGEVIRVNGQNAYAHTMMGKLRRHQFRFEDSLTELRVALEMTPNFPPTIADLAKTLTFIGQPATAIPLLERSLQLSPHDYYAPSSHAYLGLCHLLLGNTEAAVTSLRTARAMGPGFYSAHWWLAAALGLKGELDAARDALRQAIEMRPDLLAQIGDRLRRASPAFVALYEKTVYPGLRRAGLPDIWAGTNERPAGWVGSEDAESASPMPHF